MISIIVLSMAPPPPPTTRLPARPSPQTFQNEAPGGRKCKPKCAPKSLEKRLPGGSEMAPKWLPEGSRGPAESRSSFLMFFCRRWSRFRWPLGAVLGWSWDPLGLSWASGWSLGPPEVPWEAPGAPWGGPNTSKNRSRNRSENPSVIGRHRIRSGATPAVVSELSEPQWGAD